jgi:serine O-acetyltransferase
MGAKPMLNSIGAPTLGENCSVGAGAKILGAVKIGDHLTVGANAVITKDIPDGAVVVGVNQILNKTFI